LEDCVRVRTTAAAIILAAVGTLPLAGIADAQPADRDCADFATQAQAQAALAARPDDPDNLDADDDGIACELLFSISFTTTPDTSTTAPDATNGGQVRSVPQGGLDTGDGTMADDGADSHVLVVAGILLTGGLAAAALRRRTARRSS
jgi:hypothetical protein